MYLSKKIHKAILQFLLISLIFLLTTYVSHSGSQPEEFRQDILIKIVDTNADEHNEQEREFVRLLRARLYDIGFEVETIDGTEIYPRNYLVQNPSTTHLITNFISDGEQLIRASLYTKNIQSPKQFQADLVSRLANKISLYLTSYEAINIRLSHARSGGVQGLESKFKEHLDQGLIYLLKNNKIDRAIKEFELAASIKPDSALPHLNLALCYKRIGNYEKRKEHINRVISIDPQNNGLKNEKALIYFSEDKFDKAVKLLESLPKDNPTFQWNLAYAYSQINQPAKSKKNLGRIIELDANSSIAFIAGERLIELERKENILAKTAQSLWISFIGLIVIGIIALIALLIRKSSKETSTLRSGLPTKDLLALRIQLSVALLSGLFSVLIITLPRLLGG